MQKTETAELIEFLSLVDGRKISTEKILAWHEVLGFLEYPVAKQAVIEAQRDSAIQYIEPKHILGKAKSIQDRKKLEMAREEQFKEKPLTFGSRMPKCQHGIGLLLCDPCCKTAAQQAGLIK
jgi:hypothetical protein